MLYPKCASYFLFFFFFFRFFLFPFVSVLFLSFYFSFFIFFFCFLFLIFSFLFILFKFCFFLSVFSCYVVRNSHLDDPLITGVLQIMPRLCLYDFSGIYSLVRNSLLERLPFTQAKMLNFRCKRAVGPDKTVVQVHIIKTNNLHFGFTGAMPIKVSKSI